VTCGDVDGPSLPLASPRPSVAVVGCVSKVGAELIRAEHGPNLTELIECPSRIRGCWSFVHATVHGYRLQL